MELNYSSILYCQYHTEKGLIIRVPEELRIIHRWFMFHLQASKASVPTDYSELGALLITVSATGLLLPLATIALVEATPLRSA